jgi:hypothetical protein
VKHVYVCHLDFHSGFFLTEAGGQLTDNRGRTGFLFFLSVVVTSYLTAGHSNCSDHF